MILGIDEEWEMPPFSSATSPQLCAPPRDKRCALFPTGRCETVRHYGLYVIGGPTAEPKPPASSNGGLTDFKLTRSV